jgi:hypothetical protein
VVFSAVKGGIPKTEDSLGEPERSMAGTLAGWHTGKNAFAGFNGSSFRLVGRRGGIMHILRVDTGVESRYEAAKHLTEGGVQHGHRDRRMHVRSSSL